MWVPPEDKDPVVRHAPTRKSMSLFGAVNLNDGQLVTMLAPVFDADTFEAFLGMLFRHRCPRRQMVAILDNAAYHHAESLTPWLQRHRKHLDVDFLPPYSPELNPHRARLEARTHESDTQPVLRNAVGFGRSRLRPTHRFR